VKTFAARWSQDDPIEFVQFTGTVFGLGGGGGGGGGWKYVNGEWVYIEPGGGEPMNELHVVMGMAKLPDPDDPPQFQPAPQKIRGVAYRMDAQAQASIAQHFGASSVNFSMVRTLGTEIDNMGFAGNIAVFEIGETDVQPGESISAFAGLEPTAASELIMTQVFTKFANPTPQMNPDTMEYWAAFTGADLETGPHLHPADFDADFEVDGNDLAAWKNGFGVASGAARSQGDADLDFDVDGDDFLVWQRASGYATPTPYVAIPEPTGMAAALTAVTAAIAASAYSRRAPATHGA
jgi:hypothetical protein